MTVCLRKFCLRLLTFWTRSIRKTSTPTLHIACRLESFLLSFLFSSALYIPLYVSGLISPANMSEVPPDSFTHLEPPNITTEREDPGAEDSGMFASPPITLMGVC